MKGEKKKSEEKKGERLRGVTQMKSLACILPLCGPNEIVKQMLNIFKLWFIKSY